MSTNSGKSPWNKGKLVGQKLPLKLKEIWAIRVRLQLADNKRDLALFNLAIDSKLRGSDLIKIKVSDISNSGVVSARAMVLQQKTTQPVQFEITEGTRESITDWLSLCVTVHYKASYSATDHLGKLRSSTSKRISNENLYSPHCRTVAKPDR